MNEGAVGRRSLFLDEGTANLDPETEAQIVDLVAQLPITRIVVAHRPALVEKAGHVYAVHGGNIEKLRGKVASIGHEENNVAQIMDELKRWNEKPAAE